MKGASMATGNATSKWVIGLAVSVVLVVSGWGTAAVLATRNAMLGEVREDTRITRTLATETDRRVYVLEEQYRTIIASLTEIKQQLKERK